ncbi:chemotaxis protein CheW [Herbaspirillum sp. WKF16]|jgi:twitching motility protein PilI|uniref:chemotaxis protein CheW n=1 Tax=Herbaspirillum sp. WKF16 TaxID=3028312 RepID=UPI0023A9DB83|nr:chemotaxis protein CheW [Herbaspirillum sp. WKF16]WDZ95358.1 chemotaxis protein CheW [Herbaspirillum sp. WKF16]
MQIPEQTVGEAATHRRREGLEAFQASLFARMDAACCEQLQARRLAVLIGDRHCLLNPAEAGEILALGGLPAPTHVPLTRAWYLGLLNIRGNLVGVADLAALAGAAPQARGRDSRVLVFAPGLAPNCGLLLSSVLGLRDISEMTQISKTYESKTELAGIVRRYKDTAGTEWNEIGLAALLSDAAFLHVGR